MDSRQIAIAEQVSVDSPSEQGPVVEQRGPDEHERASAAVELLRRSQVGLRRTARRYSLCGEDAEDAYQRGLEILLTKAPTRDLAELRAWLTTVIKHEALALQKQRRRLVAGEPWDGATTDGPDEHAPERERVALSAEALGSLKKAELRCMLLKALGYSYDEIAERTGYSWTKVNRSLTEGRKKFFSRFEEIERGGVCGSVAETLAAADHGKLDQQQLANVQAHLRGCATCRSRLRAQRAGSHAAIAIPAFVFAAGMRPSGVPGWWCRLQDTAAIAAARFQQLGELAFGQKVAAVAASTAAVAGGVVVGEQGPPTKKQRPAAERAAASRPLPAESSPAPAPARPQKRGPLAADPGEARPAPQDQAADRPSVGEFSPEAQPRQAQEPAARRPPAGEQRSSEFAPRSDRPDRGAESAAPSKPAKEFSP